MANSDAPQTPYEAAAAPLKEKEARLVAELDAVRKSLEAIEVASVAGGFSSSPPRGVQRSSVVISDKYKGMGLEQASAKFLSESDHIELTAKQIWAALSAAGFSLLSDRPEQSVSWALRKRERKVHDVILVGDGKWGMVSWYSQARLKELRDSRNNASGRNHVEHVEKTKAGIANARKTRLNNWGPKRRITAEQMALAYHAIRNGAKSKLAAAKAAGLVWPTFNFYWCTYEMEKWKPGEPFPPPRRTTPKKGREIKFEEMWPHEDGRTNGHANGNGTAVVSTVPH